MKFNVEFEDLKEIVVFADFIKGKAAPAQKAAQQVGTAQQAAAPQQAAPPAYTPAAPPVQAATPTQQLAQQGGVPTAAPSYTLEELGRAGVTLMESGKKAELEALVASFGVASLQQLPEAQYGAFATALRSMGAPI